MLSVMMIAAALGAHVAGESVVEEVILARVEVRGPDGEWIVLGSPTRADPFILPLTSLSELVQRPGVRSVETIGGTTLEIELGFIPGNASARFKESVVTHYHQPNEQLLWVDGSAALFGPFTPPRAIEATTGADLASVVRRDDNVVRGGVLVVTPPEDAGDRMLIFGAAARPFGDSFRGWPIQIDGRPYLLPARATAPLVIDTPGGNVTMELNGALVDAIAFASERKVPIGYGEGTSAIAQDDVRSDPYGGSEVFIRKSLPLPSGIRPVDRSDFWGGREDDGDVIPAGHRRRNWYPARATSFAGLSAMTFVIEPRMQGASDKSPDAGPPRLRDHDPRSLVRRDTVDLSAYTAIDSPESLVEATVASGLGTFVHFEGPREQLDIRPTMGPGAAWGDVNGDGWLDLVLLQGAGRDGCDPLPDRLYLGGDGGVFTDATATAGLGRGDAGMGALLVDLDGDGDLDLYCANYGRDRLFLNNGDATFTDKSDLLPDLDVWSASVTAADPDGDGDLDLYITSYLDYDPAKMPPADELGRYQREDPIEMLPFAFPGQRNVYLRSTLAQKGDSDGELGFEDVTEELGLLDVQGRSMQAIFWDFDRDGNEDLYVANDVSFNVLFRNGGDGTFKDVSFSTGLDDPRGGMGLAVGDVDGDGDEDVFLTNWQLEANALYLNGLVSNTGRKRRRASFHDATVKSGIGPTGIGKTSWGAEFFDLELDGDLDLYVANGYTSPDYESTGICVGQTDQLFVGDGRGKLKEACILGRRAFSLSFASRGAIGADHDRDGDIDILVTANNRRVTLLRNDAKRQGHWLGVRLAQPGFNRNAIGAAVTVTTSDGRSRRQTLRAGTGYLTGNAPELHFGLGPVESITAITVEWPDGETTTHSAELDAWVTLSR